MLSMVSDPFRLSFLERAGKVNAAQFLFMGNPYESTTFPYVPTCLKNHTTSSWKEQHTLANWTGQKGVDFSKSMLFWVGKSKKQKISSMESQNIAISKFGNLSITDLEVIDDF